LFSEHDGTIAKHSSKSLRDDKRSGKEGRSRAKADVSMHQSQSGDASVIAATMTHWERLLVFGALGRALPQRAASPGRTKNVRGLRVCPARP